ncbi:MAG: hypothetical protein V2A75_01335 [Pseudomonadota bacterium]
MIGIDEVREILSMRPAVHKLMEGGFLQEPLKLKDDVYAIPFRPLGFDKEADYTAKYVIEICRGEVDQIALDTLKKQGESAKPVIAFVAIINGDHTPEAMEQIAESMFSIPEKIVSWASGDSLVPFAYVTATQEQTYFRMLPPHSRMRQRLGFGNIGNDFSDQLERMIQAGEKDEHFLFAIGLYQDATAERNEVFKIARLFSCLESLAYKLKADGIGSRKAVKILLGLEESAIMQCSEHGVDYRFDRIEIAGRLRDKLFHGVPFRESDLNAESRHVFELLEKNPRVIADALLGDCEIEFARWANGASNGLNTNKGTVNDLH